MAKRKRNKTLSTFAFSLPFVVFCVCAGQWSPILNAQQSNQPASDNSMLSVLLLAVEENPDHSDSWRLLGKIYARQGQHMEAEEAFDKSLELMPGNVATHYDLGNLLCDTNRSGAGRFHHTRVIEMAPDSEYAIRLRNSGFMPWIPDSDQSPGSAEGVAIADSIGTESYAVEQTGYELQTFDGSGDLQRRAEAVIDQELTADPVRLLIHAQTGVLHNSNVTLTPISRELAILDLASAQWVGNVETEWTALENGLWRFGTIGRGYFTANESHLADLNLQSYHGGTFLSRDMQVDDQQWIARIEYVYSLDQFAGSTLGDQHMLTSSLTRILPDLSVVYSYASLGVTQFDDDGIIPQTDSLDGPVWSLGTGRYFLSAWECVDTWSVGMDFQSVDTEGDNFRYNALSTYASVDWILTPRLNLEMTGGIGYRDYTDFTFPGGRDEWTWRAGAEMVYQLRPNIAIALVANYDRFSSQNDLFDVDRLSAGILTTVSRH